MIFHLFFALFPLVFSQIHGDVRLVNGNSPDKGILEVFAYRAWSLVCEYPSYSWYRDESRVICRQLGYMGLYEFEGRDAFGRYGEVNTSLYVADVSCNGDEEHFSLCDIPHFESRRCDVERDAIWIDCGGYPDIRYLDREYEVFDNIAINSHNDDCSLDFHGHADTYESHEECMALCNSVSGCIGYSYRKEDENNPNYNRCFLIERRDRKCPLVNNTEFISALIKWPQCEPLRVEHSQNAEKNCANVELGTHCTFQCDPGYVLDGLYPTCSEDTWDWETTPKCVVKDSTIRLTQGDNSTFGRVELLHENEWGTICSSNFTDSDGRYVCESLGLCYLAFTTMEKALNDSTILFQEEDLSSVPIWLDGLGCQMNSSSVFSIPECYDKEWESHACDHSQDVVVTCRARPCNFETLHDTALFGSDDDCDLGETNFDDTESWTFDRYFSHEDCAMLCQYERECFGYTYRKDNSEHNNNNKCRLLTEKNYECASINSTNYVSGLKDHTVRLSGGKSKWEGIIQINMFGVWVEIEQPTYSYDSEWKNIDEVFGELACRSIGGYLVIPRLWTDFVEMQPNQEKTDFWMEQYDYLPCYEDSTGINDGCDISPRDMAFKDEGFVPAAIECADASEVHDLTVRLFGSNFPNQGRPEIFFSKGVSGEGVWIPLCMTDETENVLGTICRQLNLGSVGYMLDWRVFGKKQYHHYGEDDLYPRISCSMYASHLDECDVRESLSTCRSYDEHNVGVVCSDPDYKPHQSSKIIHHESNECVEEIEIDPLPDHEYSCEALCNFHNERCIAFMIQVSSRQCTLFERANLYNNECLPSFEEDSDYISYVRVQDYDVRLDGGPNDMEGTLQVYNDGTWGTFCHTKGGSIEYTPEREPEYFIYEAAELICGMLDGYLLSVDMKEQNDDDTFSWISSQYDLYNCEGDDEGNSVFDCAPNNFDNAQRVYSETSSCINGLEVYLKCGNYTDIENGSIRLFGSPNEYDGRLEFFYDGQWGNVCAETLRKPEADVACKSLGYKEAIMLLGNWHFYRGGDSRWFSTPTLLQTINCTGQETNLMDCDVSDWLDVDCARNGVGLACTNNNTGGQGDIRFAEDSNQNGAIEMYKDGEWKGICNRYERISQAEGQVMCVQLGFDHVDEAYGDLEYAKDENIDSDTLLNTLDGHDLECFGDESNLFECRSEGFEESHLFFSDCDLDDGVYGVSCTHNWFDIPEQCHVVHGVIWCSHLSRCDATCSSTCESHGFRYLSNSDRVARFQEFTGCMAISRHFEFQAEDHGDNENYVQFFEVRCLLDASGSHNFENGSPVLNTSLLYCSPDCENLISDWEMESESSTCDSTTSQLSICPCAHENFNKHEQKTCRNAVPYKSKDVGSKSECKESCSESIACKAYQYRKKDDKNCLLFRDCDVDNLKKGEYDLYIKDTSFLTIQQEIQQDDAGTSKSLTTGHKVIIIIFSVLAFIICVWIICSCVRRKKRKENDENGAHEAVVPHEIQMEVQ